MVLKFPTAYRLLHKPFWVRWNGTDHRGGISPKIIGSPIYGTYHAAVQYATKCAGVSTHWQPAAKRGSEPCKTPRTP